jgi:hypothetical protein
MADFPVAQISKTLLAATIGAIAAGALILAESTKNPTSVAIAAEPTAFAETGGLSIEKGRLSNSRFGVKHSRVTSSPPFCSAHSCWLPPVDGAESG